MRVSTQRDHDKKEGKGKANKLVVVSCYLYLFLMMIFCWFVFRVISLCLFQMVNSHHAAQFLHQRSPCLWIWRITTARPWISSSPPHLHGHSKPLPSPRPTWTALSPTWTCSTWRTAPNQTRQSTETWTPSSGPMGQRTARRARAMRSSRSRWGTLPTWMKSKTTTPHVYYTERK